MEGQMVGLDRKSIGRDAARRLADGTMSRKGGFKVASQMAFSASLPNSNTMLSINIRFYVSIIIRAVLCS